MALSLAARKVRRIDLGKNFVERQRDLHAVAVVLRSKDRWDQRAQFAKGNSYRAASELVNNPIHRERDREVGDESLLDARLELQRKDSNDRVKGNPNERACRSGMRR